MKVGVHEEYRLNEIQENEEPRINIEILTLSTIMLLYKHRYLNLNRNCNNKQSSCYVMRWLSADYDRITITYSNE